VVMLCVPLSRMMGFSPAAARVRAANSPDGPDPTITTLGTEACSDRDWDRVLTTGAGVSVMVRCDMV
jgi:hypothetical protein